MVWRGLAWSGKAGKAQRGGAWIGQAGYGWVWQVRHGVIGRGVVRHGRYGEAS